MSIKILRQYVYSTILLVCWIAIILLKERTNSNLAFTIIWMSTGLFIIITSKIIYYRYTLFQKLWFLFILYTFISTLFNSLIHTMNNYSGEVRILDSLFQYLLPVIVIFMFSRYNFHKFFYHIYNIFIIACSCVGLFEFITKKQFYIKMITNENALYNFNYYSNIVKASYRLTLLFYHPIYYSVILVVGLFCIVYFPFRNKLVQVVSLLLVLLNLILTQSRTGWVVVGLCGLLYLIKHHHIQFTKKKLAAIYELLTLLLVGIGIFLLVRPEIVSSLVSIVKVRFDQAANGSATDVRFANFIVVKNIISDLSNLQITIFGGGNMYAISYLQNNPTFGYWNSAIDNSFLTVLLNYGIIGLFLLVIFIFQVIHVFFTKLSPERELSVLIVISIFIASFFFDIIGDNIIYYLLTIFIMLLPNNKVYESDNLMED